MSRGNGRPGRSGRSGRSDGQGGQRHAFTAAEDPRQMLAMAFGLHQAGQLSRARPLYEQVLEKEPKNSDALQFLGLLHFQSGNAPRARELIEQAIREKPGVAPYHDNLGTVLESLGELEAALAAYERASELEPGVADRSFNKGVVLERLQRFDSAEQSYRQAIKAAPQEADYHFNLGNVLKAQGRLTDAVKCYRRALTLNPGSGGISNNLANALMLAGDAEGAADLLRRAVTEHPEDPTLQNGLGSALSRLGKLESAAKCFRRALELDPRVEESHRNLGNLLLRTGALDKSAQVFLRAMSRFPSSREVRRGFIAAARFLLPDAYSAEFSQAVATCMEDKETAPQQLARVAARVVCLRHEGLRSEGFEPERAASALAADPLALDLLRRTINVDQRLEGILTRVRRWLLSQHGESARGLPAEVIDLGCALALQCFNNEFVFPQDDEEARIVRECVESIESTGGRGELRRLTDLIVLVALYRPLATLKCAAALAARDDWPGPLVELVRRALREPLEEARIEAEVPSMCAIRDSTSIEVQAQYESNPYPRWLDVGRVEPQSYAEFFQRNFPHFGQASRFEGSSQVLVAGCGTGIEAINTALSRTGVEVTGIDLSRPSLAYAERMARELKLGNVRFLQGDVLDLDSLEKRYDVIECSGVLHHMADPMAGWRVLVNRLTAGGVMKLGLYSELARAPVVTAREAIRAGGYAAGPEGIRAIRQKIFDAPADDALAELAFSEDLYTTSSCRDLLFHVCEHRFRLAEIRDALKSLGLEFIGFELPHPSMQTLYREFNPDDVHMTDLEAWSQFEAKNPDAFAAMYVFWCHKPGKS